MKKIYTEENIFSANHYRKEYLSGIQQFTNAVAMRNREARTKVITAEYFAKNREYLRNVFLNMVGYPLNNYEYSIPNAEKTFVGSDDYCDIYRITINTIEKINFYGILTIPKEKKDRYPLLIAQHGGLGTPELICDIHEKNNYAHISKIASENGFVVFAPQLLLWNYKFNDRVNYGEDMGFDRIKINSLLQQNSSSIIALEIYNIRKSLDYLENLPFIDETKIGMIGLSYGGFYTLYTTAADKRIKAAYSCAAFNDRNEQGCSDWHFYNSNKLLQDAEVAALCAPRALFIDVGKQDEVFYYEPAINEAKRAKELYETHGEGIFRFNLWDGGHRIDVNGPYLNDFFDIIKDA